LDWWGDWNAFSESQKAVHYRGNPECGARKRAQRGLYTSVTLVQNRPLGKSAKASPKQQVATLAVFFAAPSEKLARILGRD
jgi:hypothetical protein